ncbi:hypothetical protein HDV04_000165 [Boothiomyces sp. JEL0838]|nr:hypothetical protein HDV04_000165 [Boothiomyces sp. JEL0838]
MFYDGPLHEYYSEFLDIEGYEEQIEPEIQIEKDPEINVSPVIRNLHLEISQTRNEMNGFYQRRNELYFITRFVKETNHVYMKKDLIACLEEMKRVWEAGLFTLIIWHFYNLLYSILYGRILFRASTKSVDDFKERNAITELHNTVRISKISCLHYLINNQHVISLHLFFTRKLLEQLKTELVYRFQLHLKLKVEYKLDVKNELLASIVFQMVNSIMQDDLESLKFKNFQLFKHLQTQSEAINEKKELQLIHTNDTQDCNPELDIVNTENIQDNYEIEDKIEFNEMKNVLESLFTKPKAKAKKESVEYQSTSEPGLMNELVSALKQRSKKITVLE